MAERDWVGEYSGAVTVCDAAGVILDMNEASAAAFEKLGGRSLIGTNLLDCHPEPSRSKLADMLAHPRVNAYTIEKGGAKKLIYQAPWTMDGQFAGIVEIALPLPESLPHFVRDA